MKSDPWRSRSFFAALLVSTSLASAAFANPSIYPTGVTRYDPSKAYSTDILFTGADHKTYLVDMNGNVVHKWNAEGFPPKLLDPKLVGGAKGVVGLQLSSIPATSKKNAEQGTGMVPGQPAVFRNKTFGFVDWPGKTIWSWGDQAPDGAALQHHDWDLLPNGDVLILSNTKHVMPGFGSRKMLDDVIYEVNQKGQIVWTWSASQHLAQFGFTPQQLALIHATPALDFLHTNDMEVLGPNHWEKAGDKRFAPDNILISSRNANFTAIISRATGDIVWRIGPNYPARNELKPGNVPEPINQISGQHDGHMIPEGLPGAGDILMFDNQGEAGYPPVALPVLGGSRVLEINPATKQIVWKYEGRDSGNSNFSFFSPFISSVQRLPNGNTMIDEGIDGRFFQITPEGDIVWEYVSPYFGETPDAPVAGKPATSNWVYRAQAVPYSWVPTTAAHSETAVNPPTISSYRD